jgi:hypothetical protein
MDPFKAMYFEAAQEDLRRFNKQVVPEPAVQTGGIQSETTQPRIASTFKHIVTSTVMWPLHLVRGTASHHATISAKIPGFHFFS